MTETEALQEIELLHQPKLMRQHSPDPGAPKRMLQYCSSCMTPYPCNTKVVLTRIQN